MKIVRVLTLPVLLAALVLAVLFVGCRREVMRQVNLATAQEAVVEVNYLFDREVTRSRSAPIDTAISRYLASVGFDGGPDRWITTDRQEYNLFWKPLGAYATPEPRPWADPNIVTDDVLARVIERFPRVAELIEMALLVDNPDCWESGMDVIRGYCTYVARGYEYTPPEPPQPEPAEQRPAGVEGWLRRLWGGSEEPSAPPAPQRGGASDPADVYANFEFQLDQIMPVCSDLYAQQRKAAQGASGAESDAQP